MARSVGQKLSEALGHRSSSTIDRVPEAAGYRARGEVRPRRLHADHGQRGLARDNSALYKDLPYDIERDFVPVTQVMRAPNVLVVNASLPVNSVKDLIALYKANPGKYSYGSGGNGSSAHLSAELFKSMAGVDVVHVPYKGATPALTDLIAGQVAMFHGEPAASDRAYQVGTRESAGRDDFATFSSFRRSQPSRIGAARLRDSGLVRPLRALRYAEGDRAAAGGGDGKGRPTAGDPGNDRGAGGEPVAQLAGRVRGDRQRRPCERRKVVTDANVKVD